MRRIGICAHPACTRKCNEDDFCAGCEEFLCVDHNGTSQWARNHDPSLHWECDEDEEDDDFLDDDDDDEFYDADYDRSETIDEEF